MYHKPENEEQLDAELKSLQGAVDAALAARKAWMDAHMQDYCKFRPGDEIYDLTTGHCLGVVSELYRFHQNHPEYDTSMSVNCQYRTDGKSHGTQGGTFDNTSRQYLSFGTKDDLIRYRESQLAYLRS